jgi:hypothetical protein
LHKTHNACVIVCFIHWETPSVCHSQIHSAEKIRDNLNNFNLAAYEYLKTEVRTSVSKSRPFLSISPWRGLQDEVSCIADFGKRWRQVPRYSLGGVGPRAGPDLMLKRNIPLYGQIENYIHTCVLVQKSIIL